MTMAFASGPGIDAERSRATPICTLPRTSTGDEDCTQIAPWADTGADRPGPKCRIPSSGEIGGTCTRGAARFSRDGEAELRSVKPCWSAILRSLASTRGAIELICPPPGIQETRTQPHSGHGGLAGSNEWNSCPHLSLRQCQSRDII